MGKKLSNTKYVVSVAEACHLLNVSRTTLWRWRQEGKLRFYQLGKRRIVYSLIQLKSFLKECEKFNDSNVSAEGGKNERQSQ